MSVVRALCFAVLSFLAFPAATCWAGLEELARAGEWEQLLAVATRRADQLPLRSEEAYLAAFAARSVGDRSAEHRFLELVVGEHDLADVARVELAQLEAGSDGDRAVDLVLSMLRRAPTRALREAAVHVAIESLATGVEGSTRRQLERSVSYLPRSLRRQLDLALALSDGDQARQRLGRLLMRSTRDLEALAAAREHQEKAGLTVVERWWVGESLYRHALYDQAAPILESLVGVRHRSLARWEVAFLRGRCSFRLGEWEEAATWYQKAVKFAGGGERAADLEIHLARTMELAGRMDEAVAAGQRAVRLKTTDERRLFLARLRLVLDQPDFAIHGISRVKKRGSRARGEMMLGLYHLRHGEPEKALRRFRAINRHPWRGPAAVLAAQIEASREQWSEVIELLQEAAIGLDTFWAERARELMVRLPTPLLHDWRGRCDASVEGSSGLTRWRNLGRWATLEPDLTELVKPRREVVKAAGLEDPNEPVSFDPGLAAELWELGLAEAAVRWDPHGLPHRDVRSTLWSARLFDSVGVPKRAIQTADAAWRMSGAQVPTRTHPVALQRTLYPLPRSEAVWQASLGSGVPWSLVAALAREESRWDPRALSRVGARGLLQLMPGTAADVADRLSRPRPTGEQLFDPEISLGLGAAEIRRLLNVFRGRWAPAVAAYNAGEEQARLWLQHCGEGCTDALYVANIGFSATRRYTSDVLAAASIYTELYGEALAPIQTN